MKQSILNHKRNIALVSACLLVAGVFMSFRYDEFGPLQKIDTPVVQQDSVPEKSNKEHLTIQEYDKLMAELGKQLQKTQAEFSTIDMEKAMKEAEAAMANINLDEIQASIDKAMKEVDLASIEKELSAAMKKADWTKLNAELKASLDEARDEIRNINMEEINKELEKAHQELEKSKSAIKNLNMEMIMDEAKENLKAAAKELVLTREMFEEMEKDGLINRKDGFSIQYKNKTLYINDKKQSDTVTEKYRRYIHREDFEITIDKE